MRTENNMTLFFTEKDAFSNWYRADFVVRGVKFNTVEQMMMYAKAKLFGDEKTATKILEAKHPKDQKALGRAVSPYDDAVWSKRRQRIVEHACYAKFSQNPEIKALLLGTKDTILVEASPYDKLWGVGLSEKDPKIFDQKNWKGQNLLGQALTTVRARLAAELAQEKESPRKTSSEDSQLEM